MNNLVAKAIRGFVTSDPFPTTVDLLNRDNPKYEWTIALVEILVGQPLKVHYDQATAGVELMSKDGTSVLRISTDGAGGHTAQGLMVDDLNALLSAIRIHEVESYDLVMLPPDMRKADLDYLCGKAGITPDRLRRFTDLWVSVK